MKSFLSLVLLTFSLSVFAGGAGSQSTTCYAKNSTLSITFPSDIREYKQNEKVSVFIQNGTQISNSEMTAFRPDEMTFTFTSENSSIKIHQKDWFLYYVVIDVVVNNQSQVEDLVCNVM